MNHYQIEIGKRQDVNDERNRNKHDKICEERTFKNKQEITQGHHPVTQRCKNLQENRSEKAGGNI